MTFWSNCADKYQQKTSTMAGKDTGKYWKMHNLISDWYWNLTCNLISGLKVMMAVHCVHTVAVDCWKQVFFTWSKFLNTPVCIKGLGKVSAAYTVLCLDNGKRKQYEGKVIKVELLCLSVLYNIPLTASCPNLILYYNYSTTSLERIPTQPRQGSATLPGLR